MRFLFHVILFLYETLNSVPVTIILNIDPRKTRNKWGCFTYYFIYIQLPFGIVAQGSFATPGNVQKS